MVYRLTDDNKRRLIKLLSPEDAEFFFSDVEYMMRNHFLPSKNQKKHILKEKAKALVKVSKTARKLRTELNMLDPYFLKFLDSGLGRKLGTPFYSESIKIGGEPALCYPSLSTKDAIWTVEEEAAIHADDLLRNYGSNYLEWITQGLRNAWSKSIDHSITASISSKFIKYVAIVLDGDPETISKQVQRTKWFTNHKKYNRDKKKKK